MSARFVVGDGYAAYRGPAIDVSEHRHAAFQIAIALSGKVTIVDGAGTEHRGSALVVSPMTPHRMLAGVELLTYFVEPKLAFADQLRERWGEGVSAAPELRGLEEDDVRFRRPSGSLDPRLRKAMDAIAGSDASLEDVAAGVGLSSQRLRTIARAELGMPLARWRVWSRLRVAARALEDGESPAEAAVTGGFADQPHMTRWMREMLGVTPGGAVRALGAQARRAT